MITCLSMIVPLGGSNTGSVIMVSISGSNEAINYYISFISSFRLYIYVTFTLAYE